MALATPLSSALAAAAARRDVTSYAPLIGADVAAVLADGGVEVVDELEAQLAQLASARAPRSGAVASPVDGVEGVWVFYPWARRLVRVLPAELHRELRVDRNRYAITLPEQAALAALRVAVAGLSVGRSVVSTLVHEGIGGELRLADFDVLDLSNLNRVIGGVSDVGVSKVVLAAREVAELDPFVRVAVYPRGVEDATVAEFVAGADVVVDECDDLAMKVLLREHARALGKPVVMATSHRGMLDVERFDLEPGRPLLHGLLGDVSSAALRRLTTKQKVPFVIRLLDPASLSERAAASLVEVKETLSTWPQLASDVALGGAMVANAVRRIALGRLTASGRFFADLDELTSEGRQAPLRLPATPEPTPAASSPPGVAAPALAGVAAPARAGAERGGDDARFVVACACSAPSGGNIQPWRFRIERGRVLAYPDPARSSVLDFRGRATRLALGCALEAAVIGAGSRGYAPEVRVGGDAAWQLSLGDRVRPRDDDAAELLWRRGSNRRTDASAPVVLDGLAAFGAPLRVEVAEDLRTLGASLGALDRVRFLSERLRHELVGELRFASGAPDGIDVDALELDATDLAAIEVLRVGAGMDTLAALDLGWGLADATRDAFAAAGGALVVRAAGLDEAALIEAGRGLLRLWLEATRTGVAIHPYGSPFLFQRLLEEPESLTDWERSAVAAAANAFTPDPPILLVLRVSRAAAPASVRSLRRPLDDVLAG
jgi:molybdopterin/thiamine biosynthesis adenylyltransferase